MAFYVHQNLYLYIKYAVGLGSLVLCVQFSFVSRKKIKSENLLSRLSLVKTIFLSSIQKAKKECAQLANYRLWCARNLFYSLAGSLCG